MTVRGSKERDPPEKPPSWPSDLGKLFTLLPPPGPQTRSQPTPAWGPGPRDEEEATLQVGVRSSQALRAQSQVCSPVSAYQGAPRLQCPSPAPSPRLCAPPAPPTSVPASCVRSPAPCQALIQPCPASLLSCPHTPLPHRLGSVWFPSFTLLWVSPPAPVPPKFCSTPPNQEALEDADIPKGKMPGGGCKQRRVGAVISLPDALAPWPLAGAGERPL